MTAREQRGAAEGGRLRRGRGARARAVESHGPPDPRALSRGRPDDADAQAAPGARRGAALKVGRPAGSGAGRPRGAETRRPTDRPTGSRGGGRRRPAEFAGRGRRDSPLPARDAARPTAPWDVEPARRLLDLRRTLRPAVSRAHAHRRRCPSVCPAACVSVCPVEGADGSRWPRPLSALSLRVSDARRAFRAVPGAGKLCGSVALSVELSGA